MKSSHNIWQNGLFWRRVTATFVILIFTLFDAFRYAPQGYASPSTVAVDPGPALFSIPKELGKIDEVYFPTTDHSPNTFQFQRSGNWGSPDYPPSNENKNQDRLQTADSLSLRARDRVREKSLQSPVSSLRSRFIVFIQDAHDSLEAQENIAKIINLLVKEKGIKTVFEEGYEGPVPTDKFFGFIKDPAIKQKVSYFLLDKLRIGGAEYAHINRKLADRVQGIGDSKKENSNDLNPKPYPLNPDWNLIGVDDLKLYRENIRHYQDASKNKKETEEDLACLLARVTILADQFFPKDLKTLLKKQERFHAGQLPLLDYLKDLHSLYLKNKEAEAAERFSGEYPALSVLLMAQSSEDRKLLDQVNLLDSSVIFKEMGKLETEISTDFLKNERDRKIFGYYQGLKLLQRLNRIELTPEEYEAVKGTLQDLRTQDLAEFVASQTHKSLVLSKEWERHIKDPVRFYEAAHSRDSSVEARLKDFSENGKEETAVLVFGGFHANKIKEILREKGFSYVVVSPRFNPDDKRHQAYYKQLMSVGHHSFEVPVHVARAARPESEFVMANAWGENVIHQRLAVMASLAGDLRSELDPATLNLMIEKGLIASDQPQSGQKATAPSIRSEARQMISGLSASKEEPKAWVVRDAKTGAEKGLAYQTPLLPKGPADLDRAWRDFHAMVFEFPKLLERAAREKLPVVLVIPEKLDGFGPLADEAPWIEGARTALAWASAYFRFKELGNVDVRVLQLPGKEVSPEQIAEGVKNILSRNIRDATGTTDYHQKDDRKSELSLAAILKKKQTPRTPEAQMEARIFRLEEVLKTTRTPESDLLLEPSAIAEIVRAGKNDAAPEIIRPVLPRVPSGKKRIVVTGAAGFIGINLVKKLLAEGNQVIALDNLISANKDFASFFRDEPDFYFRQWDVSESFEIEGPVDQVLHLASLASPPDYYGHPREALRAGLQAIREMMELARRKHAQFLFTSTSEVYGDAAVHPQPETYAGNVSPFRMRSQYDQSKRGAETLMKLYASRYAGEGLDLRIARIFNTYGPFMRIDDGRVITNFIEKVLQGKPIEINGNDKITRSFGYVDDTVDGLLKLLRSDKLGPETPVQKRVFNIGNDSEFTLRELADLVNALGQKYLHRTVPVRIAEVKDPSDPARRRPDLTRARVFLGYAPAIPLREGLEKTFLHFLNTRSGKARSEARPDPKAARSEMRDAGAKQTGEDLAEGVRPQVSIVIGTTLSDDTFIDRLSEYLHSEQSGKVSEQVIVTVDARSQTLRRERFEELKRLSEEPGSKTSGRTFQLVTNPRAHEAGQALQQGIALATGEATILAEDRAPLGGDFFEALALPVLQASTDTVSDDSGLYTAIKTRALKEIKLNERGPLIHAEIKAKLERLAYTSQTVSVLSAEERARFAARPGSMILERIRAAAVKLICSVMPAESSYRGQYEFEKSMESMAKLPRLPEGQKRKVSIVISSRSGTRFFSPDEEIEGQDALRVKVRQELDVLFALNSSYDYELIIVDDSSPEGKTGKRIAQKAEELFPEYVRSGKVRVIFSKNKKSQKGGGILFGMKDALDRGADYLVYTDVDLSTNLIQVGSLLERIVAGGAGVAIGSRGHPRSRVVGREGFRSISSALYNIAVRFILPLGKIRDTQAGFKAFSREAALAVVPDTKDLLLSFDTELLLLAREKGFTVEEVPVYWKESRVGTSVSVILQVFHMTVGLLEQRIRMSGRVLTRPGIHLSAELSIVGSRAAIAAIRFVQIFLQAYRRVKNFVTTLPFLKTQHVPKAFELREASLDKKRVRDLTAEARWIVREASLILADFRGRLSSLDVKTKIEPGSGNPTLVTEADETIQQFVITEIQRSFPKHFVIAEEKMENEISRKNWQNADSDFVWILDPIDGTKEFLKPGSDYYGISLALYYKGRPVLAVVASPRFGMIEASAERSGIYLNGKQVRVSQESSTGELRAVIDDDPQNVLAPILGVGDGWKSISHNTRSVVLNLAGIAYSGQDTEAPHLFWKGGDHGPSLWDIAASSYLLKKAGGIFKKAGGVVTAGFVAFSIEQGTAVEIGRAIHQTILDRAQRDRHFSILAGTPPAVLAATITIQKNLGGGMAQSTKSQDLAVTPVTFDQKIHAVRSHYDLELSDPLIAYPIGHAVKPQVPILLRSKEGSFVFKKLSTSRPGAQYIVSYQNALQQSGVSSVPRLIPLKGRAGNVADDFLVELDGGYYVLEEAISRGVEIRYEDANLKQFEDLGALIAAFQNISGGFKLEGGKSEKPLIAILERDKDFESLGIALRIRELTAGAARLGRGEKLFLENLPLVLSQMKILRANLPDSLYERLPKAFVSADLSLHNMRFTGDGHTALAVYDYGKLRYQARLEDLKNPAMARGPEKGRSYDLEVLQAIVRGYQAEAREPLTVEELEALPEFIRGTFLWQYAGWFLLEMSKLNTDDAIYEQAVALFKRFERFTRDFPAGKPFGARLESSTISRKDVLRSEVRLHTGEDVPLDASVSKTNAMTQSASPIVRAEMRDETVSSPTSMVITGASGDLGAMLGRYAEAQRSPLKLIVRSPNSKKKYSDRTLREASGAEFYLSDLFDRVKMKKVIAQSPVFYHLAALVGLDKDAGTYPENFKVNGLAAIGLLKMAEEVNPDVRFIFASSERVISIEKNPAINRWIEGALQLIDENPELFQEPNYSTAMDKLTELILSKYPFPEGVYPYELSKLLVERYIQRGVLKKAVAVRITSIYGPGNLSGRKMQRMIEARLLGRTITEKREIRDYIYIQDAIEVLYQLGVRKDLPEQRVVDLAPQAEVSAEKIWDMIVKHTPDAKGKIEWKGEPTPANPQSNQISRNLLGRDFTYIETGVRNQIDEARRRLDPGIPAETGKGPVLVIDAGGTSTRMAVWDGEKLTDAIKFPTVNYTSAEAQGKPIDRMQEVWLESLAQKIREYRERHPDIQSVSMGFAGPVGEDGDLTESSVIWGPDRNRIPHAVLQNRWGLPVKVVNDLTTAVYRYGRSPKFAGMRTIALITVSSGIGSKLFDVVHGNVVIDRQGRAGEIGHTIVDYAGNAIQGEGLKGELNAYASGRGLSNLAKRMAGQKKYRTFYEGSALRAEIEKTGQTIETVDRDVLTRLLVELIKKNDGFSIQVMKSSVGYLVRVLGPFILQNAPDAIVWMGSIAENLEPVYLDEVIEQLISKGLYGYNRDDLKKMFVMGEKDDENGLRGAGLMACDKQGVASAQPAYDPGYVRDNVDPHGHNVIEAVAPNDVQQRNYYTEGAFDLDNRVLANVLEGRNVIFVVEKAVADKVLEPLKRYLQHYHMEGRCKGEIQVLDGGEKIKSAEQVKSLTDYAQERNLDRNGVFVVVGGGAIMDMVGMVANQFRRGVRYVRIPTTLLGQVDAAVGVKVGIDYRTAKNFLGAFYPPFATITDTRFLETLPERQIQGGIAEIIKVALISNTSLFEVLEKYGTAFIRDMPRDAKWTFIKDAAVELLKHLQMDFFEHNLMRHVDFGHVLAHKFESMTNYELTHGEAVAIDILMSAFIAHARGMLSDKDFRRILSLHIKLKLPFYHPALNPDRAWEGLEDAKAHKGGRLMMVVPIGIGRTAFVDSLRRDELDAALDFLRRHQEQADDAVMTHEIEENHPPAELKYLGRYLETLPRDPTNYATEITGVLEELVTPSVQKVINIAMNQSLDPKIWGQALGMLTKFGLHSDSAGTVFTLESARSPDLKKIRFVRQGTTFIPDLPTQTQTETEIAQQLLDRDTFAFGLDDVLISPAGFDPEVIGLIIELLKRHKTVALVTARGLTVEDYFANIRKGDGIGILKNIFEHPDFKPEMLGRLFAYTGFGTYKYGFRLRHNQQPPSWFNVEPVLETKFSAKFVASKTFSEEDGKYLPAIMRKILEIENGFSTDFGFPNPDRDYEGFVRGAKIQEDERAILYFPQSKQGEIENWKLRIMLENLKEALSRALPPEVFSLLTFRVVSRKGIVVAKTFNQKNEALLDLEAMGLSRKKVSFWGHDFAADGLEVSLLKLPGLTRVSVAAPLPGEVPVLQLRSSDADTGPDRAKRILKAYFKLINENSRRSEMRTGEDAVSQALRRIRINGELLILENVRETSLGVFRREADVLGSMDPEWVLRSIFGKASSEVISEDEKRMFFYEGRIQPVNVVFHPKFRPAEMLHSNAPKKGVPITGSHQPLSVVMGESIVHALLEKLRGTPEGRRMLEQMKGDPTRSFIIGKYNAGLVPGILASLELGIPMITLTKRSFDPFDPTLPAGESVVQMEEQHMLRDSPEYFSHMVVPAGSRFFLIDDESTTGRVVVNIANMLKAANAGLDGAAVVLRTSKEASERLEGGAVPYFYLDFLTEEELAKVSAALDRQHMFPFKQPVELYMPPESVEAQGLSGPTDLDLDIRHYPRRNDPGRVWTDHAFRGMTVPLTPDQLRKFGPAMQQKIEKVLGTPLATIRREYYKEGKTVYVLGPSTSGFYGGVALSQASHVPFVGVTNRPEPVGYDEMSSLAVNYIGLDGYAYSMYRLMPGDAVILVTGELTDGEEQMRMITALEQKGVKVLASSSMIENSHYHGRQRVGQEAKVPVVSMAEYAADEGVPVHNISGRVWAALKYATMRLEEEVRRTHPQASVKEILSFPNSLTAGILLDQSDFDSTYVIVEGVSQEELQALQPLMKQWLTGSGIKMDAGDGKVPQLLSADHQKKIWGPEGRNLLPYISLYSNGQFIGPEEQIRRGVLPLMVLPDKHVARIKWFLSLGELDPEYARKLIERGSADQQMDWLARRCVEIRGFMDAFEKRRLSPVALRWIEKLDEAYRSGTMSLAVAEEDDKSLADGLRELLMEKMVRIFDGKLVLVWRERSASMSDSYWRETISVPGRESVITAAYEERLRQRKDALDVLNHWDRNTDPELVIMKIRSWSAQRTLTEDQKQQFDDVLGFSPAVRAAAITAMATRADEMWGTVQENILRILEEHSARELHDSGPNIFAAETMQVCVYALIMALWIKSGSLNANEAVKFLLDCIYPFDGRPRISPLVMRSLMRNLRSVVPQVTDPQLRDRLQFLSLGYGVSLPGMMTLEGLAHRIGFLNDYIHSFEGQYTDKLEEIAESLNEFREDIRWLSRLAGSNNQEVGTLTVRGVLERSGFKLASQGAQISIGEGADFKLSPEGSWRSTVSPRLTSREDISEILKKKDVFVFDVDDTLVTLHDYVSPAMIDHLIRLFQEGKTVAIDTLRVFNPADFSNLEKGRGLGFLKNLFGYPGFKPEYFDRFLLYSSGAGHKFTFRIGDRDKIEIVEDQAYFERYGKQRRWKEDEAGEGPKIVSALYELDRRWQEIFGFAPTPKMLDQFEKEKTRGTNSPFLYAPNFDYYVNPKNQMPRWQLRIMLSDLRKALSGQLSPTFFGRLVFRSPDGRVLLVGKKTTGKNDAIVDLEGMGHSRERMIVFDDEFQADGVARSFLDLSGLDVISVGKPLPGNFSLIQPPHEEGALSAKETERIFDHYFQSKGTGVARSEMRAADDPKHPLEGALTSAAKRAEMRTQWKNEIKSSLKNLDTFVQVMVRLRQTLAEEGKGPGLLSRWLFEVTRNDAILQQLVSDYRNKLKKIALQTGAGSEWDIALKVIENIGVGHVVMISPEIAPFSIAGGMAQVLEGLPKALAQAGSEVSIVTFLYNESQGKKHTSAEELLRNGIQMGGKTVRLEATGRRVQVALGPTINVFSNRVESPAHTETAEVYRAQNEGVTIYFLYHPHLANRLYPSVSSSDQLKRSILLSRGSLEVMREFDLYPDFILAHDWMAAPAFAYLKADPIPGDFDYRTDEHFYDLETGLVPKLGFAMHNLGRDYQARFFTIENGIDLWPLFRLQGQHYRGLSNREGENPDHPTRLNLVRGGILHSDFALTVSKSYAREIQTPEKGNGLHEDFLKKGKVYGISNGIDIEALRTEFIRMGGGDPGTEDPAAFFQNLPQFKDFAKREIQNKYGLEEREDAILVSMVGRIADQKGVELVASEAKNILDRDPRVQLLIAGPIADFDPSAYALRDAIRALEADPKYAGRVRGEFEFIAFREALRIYLASDLFLMPSKYEPGGLSQLESLSAGTAVVAHEVGGIADTLNEFDPQRGMGDAFFFQEFNGKGFLRAVTRGIQAIRNKDHRKTIVLQAAVAAHGWNDKVSAYFNMFRNESGVFEYDYPHLREEQAQLDRIIARPSEASEGTKRSEVRGISGTTGKAKRTTEEKNTLSVERNALSKAEGRRPDPPLQSEGQIRPETRYVNEPTASILNVWAMKRADRTRDLFATIARPLQQNPLFAAAVSERRSEVRVETDMRHTLTNIQAGKRNATSHKDIADRMVRDIRKSVQPATVFVDAEDFPNLSVAQKNEYFYAALSGQGVRIVVYNERGQVRDQELGALLKLDHVTRTDRGLAGAQSSFDRPGAPGIHLSKQILPSQELVQRLRKRVSFFKTQGQNGGTLAAALLWAWSGGEDARLREVSQGRDGFWIVAESLVNALQRSYDATLAFAVAA
ncbi:MAG: inositol monophosphatase family protein [Candidatus Omnitrophota bacterium]